MSGTLEGQGSRDVVPDRLKIAAGLLAGALALAGCGVRGNLELPPDAKAKQAATATAGSGQGKAEGAAPSPHKGFILDGLLR